MTITTVGPPQASSTPHRLERGAGPLQRVKWFGQALALAVFWQVVKRMSPDRAAAFGRSVVRGLTPRLRRTARIMRNLSIACPEKTPRQIEQLAREVWGSVGQLLSEYAHLGTLCVDERDARIEIVQNWDLEAARRAGKPVVFVTAHMANWEISAGATAAMGVPLAVVYAPLDNPVLDRMLQRWRSAMSCDFLSKPEAGRELLRALRNGKSVGLLVDQRVSDGAPVPFFGQAACTSITPARLALKFGCELVPVQVERIGGSRFRVTYHRPVKPSDEAADDQEKALDMTRRINEHFESWIRKRPEQWICWKRRWPRSADVHASPNPAP